MKKEFWKTMVQEGWEGPHHPEGVDGNGKTALMHAVMMHIPGIEKLVESCKNVNTVDEYSWNVLHYFALTHDLTPREEIPVLLLASLVSKGADINHIDDQGETPLFHTTLNPALAEAFLQFGASPLVENKQGDNVLTKALDEKCIECVRLFKPWFEKRELERVLTGKSVNLPQNPPPSRL